MRSLRDIIRHGKDLLDVHIDKQVIITKARIVHVSVENFRPQTPFIATRKCVKYQRIDGFPYHSHVTISLIFA